MALASNVFLLMVILLPLEGNFAMLARLAGSMLREHVCLCIDFFIVIWFVTFAQHVLA